MTGARRITPATEIATESKGCARAAVHLGFVRSNVAAWMVCGTGGGAATTVAGGAG